MKIEILNVAADFLGGEGDRRFNKMRMHLVYQAVLGKWIAKGFAASKIYPGTVCRRLRIFLEITRDLILRRADL